MIWRKMKNQDVGWKSSCNCIDIMYPFHHRRQLCMRSLALAPKFGADPDLHSHCHELAALEINKQVMIGVYSTMLKVWNPIHYFFGVAG